MGFELSSPVGCSFSEESMCSKEFTVERLKRKLAKFENLFLPFCDNHATRRRQTHKIPTKQFKHNKPHPLNSKSKAASIHVQLQVPKKMYISILLCYIRYKQKKRSILSSSYHKVVKNVSQSILSVILSNSSVHIFKLHP
jgi:hypothetical protein